jgi:sigma-B regulation protein RsbU (phosphoserine phosphatase)
MTGCWCAARWPRAHLYEADFIEGLALQAAVALENARNHKRNVEFARVQQDLDAAGSFSARCCRRSCPNIPGYSMGFRSPPATRWAATISTSSSCRTAASSWPWPMWPARAGFGHHVSTSFRSAFRAMAVTGMPLDELATRMNQHHWEEGEESRRRYVTAIFCASIPRPARWKSSTPATIPASWWSRTASAPV